MHYTLCYVQISHGTPGKLVTPLRSEATSNGSSGNRLIIFDKTSNLNFLIDTGADISLLPKKVLFKPLPINLKLFAANDSQIDTYGFKTLILNLGLRRTFK